MSKSGSDSNSCTSGSSPCLTITAGFTAAVNAGGSAARVVIISNGGFQENVSLTANAGVTSYELLTSNDVWAMIAPTTGTTGLNINVNPTDAVRIYNVRFGGSGGLIATGINIASASRVEIHNTSIRGFGTANVNLAPSGSTSSDLYIYNSDVAESNGNCVTAKPSGSMTANVTIKNTQIHHCSSAGVRSDASLTTGFVRSLVSYSIVSNTGANAVTAVSAAGQGQARVVVENSDITNSNTAANANGASAFVILNQSQVMGNSVALNTLNGGTVFSYGNNALSFNGSPGVTPSLLPLQ